MLITGLLGFSTSSARIGICAEKRGVPNIVVILADDKY
jgi:hypothetical protein